MPQTAKDFATSAASPDKARAPAFGVFHAGPEKPNAKRTLNAAVTRQHKKDKVIDEDDETQATDKGASSDEREGKKG